jgi:hypothetical protein
MIVPKDQPAAGLHPRQRRFQPGIVARIAHQRAMRSLGPMARSIRDWRFLIPL